MEKTDFSKKTAIIDGLVLDKEEQAEHLEVAAARLLASDLYVHQMEGLLKTLCQGLEEKEITMPPELLDWWCGYKDSQYIGPSITEMLEGNEEEPPSSPTGDV